MWTPLMHLMRVLEVDAVECDHGPEGLGGTTNAQDRFHPGGNDGVDGVSHASLACMLRNRFST